MGFKIGEKVSYIDEVGGGEVVGVERNLITILDEDGFEQLVDESKLIKKHDFLKMEGQSGSNLIKDELSENYSKPKIKTEVITDVVDLHFHELTHTDLGYADFEKLRIQLDTAKQAIDKAILARKKKIVFIHGIGSGVLKSELRKLIDSIDNCTFDDADWRLYGQGATAVFIRFN